MQRNSLGNGGIWTGFLLTIIGPICIYPTQQPTWVKTNWLPRFIGDDHSIAVHRLPVDKCRNSTWVCSLFHCIRINSPHQHTAQCNGSIFIHKVLHVAEIPGKTNQDKKYPPKVHWRLHQSSFIISRFRWIILWLKKFHRPRHNKTFQQVPRKQTLCPNKAL